MWDEQGRKRTLNRKYLLWFHFDMLSVREAAYNFFLYWQTAMHRQGHACAQSKPLSHLRFLCRWSCLLVAKTFKLSIGQFVAHSHQVALCTVFHLWEEQATSHVSIYKNKVGQRVFWQVTALRLKSDHRVENQSSVSMSSL